VCYRACSCCLRRHVGDFRVVEGAVGARAAHESQMKPFPSTGAALLNEGCMYSLCACYLKLIPLVLEIELLLLNEWH
jgi:hypothetical protein